MSTIHPGVTGRRGSGKSGADRTIPQQQAPPAGHEPVAFTILEFCQSHRISVAFFYELRKAGLAPRTMSGLGNRQIISAEEAARWRTERTEATADDSESAA